MALRRGDPWVRRSDARRPRVGPACPSVRPARSILSSAIQATTRRTASDMAPGIDALNGGARRHAAAFEGVTVTRRRRELVRDASFTVGSGELSIEFSHAGPGAKADSV